MYRLRTTALYDRQVEDLSPEANALLVRKVEMLLRDPAHFKGLARNRFRIRFSDRRKQKRLVYRIDDDVVTLLMIIDRDKDYRELDET